jgi:hypothetical protein
MTLARLWRAADEADMHPPKMNKTGPEIGGLSEIPSPNPISIGPGTTVNGSLRGCRTIGNGKYSKMKRRENFCDLFEGKEKHVFRDYPDFTR